MSILPLGRARLRRAVTFPPVQDKNLCVVGGAVLLRRPRLLSRAVTPPCREGEDFCHAPHSITSPHSCLTNRHGGVFCNKASEGIGDVVKHLTIASKGSDCSASRKGRTGHSKRGRFLALSRWWMAVAQVPVSRAQNCLAHPPALPAVVRRPTLRSEAMATISDLDSLDSVSSVFSCCIFGFRCHFPRPGISL